MNISEPQSYYTPPNGYVLEDTAAEWLGVTVPTLRTWASRRRGPARTRVGKRILYRQNALADWLERQEVDPEAARQAGRAVKNA